MNKLTELFLKNRGYDVDFLSSIDIPTHKDLKDIDMLSNHLKEIYDKNQNLVIIPDFDMDGIMSGVLGFAGLSELGFRVSLFIPNPKDGYGFTEESIERLLTEYPNTDAIITCDVGIDCHEGIRAAKARGLKVLITDHHKVLSMPDADVVVDPMREDDSYEHKEICGAHVLYQCLEYYANKYTDFHMKEQISRLRVFAGIGTVSDSMPVLYENRAIIRDAISICRYIYSEGDEVIVNSLPGSNVYRRAFRGLYDLLDVFSAEGKISSLKDMDETFFGFYLAPLFNAVKRMDGNMTDAFNVFFGRDRKECIGKLYQMNEERKLLVEEYLDAMDESNQPYAPYIYMTDAPAGLLGLLAMRKMLVNGMPVIVLNKTSHGYSGSGRSPEWYPFLERTKTLPIYAAGHEGAFGVRIDEDSVFDMLFMFLTSDVADVYENTPKVEREYDFVISSLGDGDTLIDIPLFIDFLHDMTMLKPFGINFPAPELLLKFRAKDGLWEAMGSNRQHLKVTLPQGFEVLAWNQAGILNNIDDKSSKIIEIKGTLNKNEWMNNVGVNFIGNVEI